MPNQVFPMPKITFIFNSVHKMQEYNNVSEE